MTRTIVRPELGQLPSVYLIEFYADNYTREDFEMLLNRRAVQGAPRKKCLSVFDCRVAGEPVPAKDWNETES